MKKLFSIALSIIVAAIFASVTLAVSVPFGDSTIVEDFDSSFQSEIDTGWGGRFGTWGGGLAFTDHTIDGGKLKTNYPVSAVNATWMVHVDNPAATDVGISFWMDASAISEEFSMRLFLGDNSAYSENKIGETIYLVPDSGTPSTSDVYGEGVGDFNVPAGFVGKIMIHIDSFDPKDGFSPDDFRTSELASFRVMMVTGYSEVKTVYFDNIQYLVEDTGSETTATPTQASSSETSDTETTTPSDGSNILYLAMALVISGISGVILLKKKILSFDN